MSQRTGQVQQGETHTNTPAKPAFEIFVDKIVPVTHNVGVVVNVVVTSAGPQGLNVLILSL